MSTYVTIAGTDLDYFKDVVQRGISGSYGEIKELRVSVNSEAGIMLGTNGYTSEYMGTVEQADPEKSSEPEKLDSLIDRIGELLPQLEKVAQFAPVPAE